MVKLKLLLKLLRKKISLFLLLFHHLQQTPFKAIKKKKKLQEQ